MVRRWKMNDEFHYFTEATADVFVTGIAEEMAQFQALWFEQQLLNGTELSDDMKYYCEDLFFERINLAMSEAMMVLDEDVEPYWRFHRGRYMGERLVDILRNQKGVHTRLDYKSGVSIDDCTRIVETIRNLTEEQKSGIREYYKQSTQQDHDVDLAELGQKLFPEIARSAGPYIRIDVLGTSKLKINMGQRPNRTRTIDPTLDDPYLELTYDFLQTGVKVPQQRNFPLTTPSGSATVVFTNNLTDHNLVVQSNKFRNEVMTFTVEPGKTGALSSVDIQTYEWTLSTEEIIKDESQSE